MASYSKRPEAVIAAKGASKKYWAKAVNTYARLNFYFLINIHKFKKINVCSRCYSGLLCAEF